MIEQHIPDELPNDRSDTRSDARVDDRSAQFEQYPQGRSVRIGADGYGVQVPGDAFQPQLLERLVDPLSPDGTEQTLCG
ncbi:radical SAM-modified peptide, FtsH ternary system-associated [Streptomyces sp. NPDC047000]|uniref:radical SAM-modified peptide, FtsH ternary system-associated n=1 Tax=Streptomyces sp. NPDC047000 TaxID=3155474 RepID=UPI0034025D1C